MTILEYFNEEMAIKRKQIKKGLYLISASFLIFIIASIFYILSALFDVEFIKVIAKIIQIFCIILFARGVWLFIKSILSLKKVLVCPNCRKSLSYFVTDSNYTNKIIWCIPPQFPENVKNCSYCKICLDDEMTF